jgi:hypothetical protein
MRQAMMIGVALAFTCLLLLFRNLLFKRRVQSPHRIYLMNPPDGHDSPFESDSSAEWPSIIARKKIPPRKRRPYLKIDASS